MSWVRLDDRFYSHRKVMSVSLAARWLYVSALCVANQHSNNGILDQAAQDCLLVAVGRSGSFDALAAELVSAGLWERHGVTDYTSHEYLEYQPSDAEQRKERAAAAEAREQVFKGRSDASGQILKGITGSSSIDPGAGSVAITVNVGGSLVTQNEVGGWLVGILGNGPGSRRGSIQVGG